MSDLDIPRFGSKGFDTPGEALDVRDHPVDSGHTATEHHWMDKVTRRGGPGPFLKDWSGSFK